MHRSLTRTMPGELPMSCRKKKKLMWPMPSLSRAHMLCRGKLLACKEQSNRAAVL